jgi:hypothetical protein
MDKDTEIREGIEAENILNSDVFKKTFTNYKNELIETWQQTSPEDVALRESIYKAIQILPEVERHLRIIINNGKITTQQIEKMSGVFKI